MNGAAPPTELAQGTPSRYSFRRLATQELPLVNELYNRCYQVRRPLAEAEWLYRNNPYGEGIIFAAFDSQGTLVGVRPTIAWRFALDGRERPAYQFTDALVAPEHRGRGIFGHLVLDMCGLAAASDVTLFSFPNSNSLPVYLRLGTLDRIARCQTLVKVLSWRRYLQYRRGRALAASAVGDRVDSQPVTEGSLSLAPIGRFSSSFDDIHTDLGRVVAGFTLRREDFLNWRYFEHPTWRYDVALVREGDRTHGYVVVRMIDHIAYVIDVFVRPDLAVMRAVPRLLSGWARRMHAAAIYFDASKGHVFEPAFRRNGFLLRRMTGDIVMDTRTMHGHLASRHAAAPSGRTLYLTTGDTDYR